VSERHEDILSEITKILKMEALELLIDGGVFAQMLRLKPEV